MNIYLITTFEKLEKGKLFAETGDSRCVGYYGHFEDAEYAVLNNAGDIHECLYDYALIEEVEDGLYPSCKPRWWYRYNNGVYEPIKEPEFVEHLCAFSIG